MTSRTDRSLTTGLDGPLRLTVAVGKSQLGRRTSTQKAVLAAIAGHADFDGTGAYPGLRRIAGAAGLGQDATIEAIRKLESRGVLKVIRSKGGKYETNRYAINLDALEATIPTVGESESIDEPAIRGNSRGERAPRSAATNCNYRRGRANHHHPSEPMNTTTMAQQSLETRSQTMDGMAVSIATGDRPALIEALRRAEIRGRNLTRLAESPALTPKIVDEELRSIRTAKNVGSVSAVLAHRLAERAGINLKDSQRSSLGQEGQAVVAGLAAARRNHTSRTIITEE